ncbi:Competence-like protein [Halorhabdus tiamatea SARL4B]|uniref:Competence-like protein n=1 Tax=Halorhabdus tiamatea SARL4B TaxID=1033806 RepID=U2E6J0_9EURY|nr:MBL fold metallo-hydrolase [Halorhabdus tiamatea]ERJ07486.1 Competence-like protein [Halorhabdus tiamatea SARL4B]
MKRVTLVILIVGLIVLGGCSGLSDDLGVGEEIDNTATSASPTESSQTPSEASSGSETGTESPQKTDSEPTSSEAEGTLEIHHIDVGQADSTLIVTPNEETILVDTGGWRDDGETVLQYLEAQGITQIDHLVETHPHADHIGGHEAVIDYFENEGGGIGAAYGPGVASSSNTHEEYLDAIERHEVDLFRVGSGDILPFGSESVNATVLNPPSESGDGTHENSVSLLIEYGETSYVITGDAESNTEQRMAQAYPERIDSEAYQAGHHGSSTSSSSAFMNAVGPEIAVISSAYESQYGHPNAETLERFDDLGIETYWTAVHGNVVLESDGSEFTVTTEDEFSTDPMDILDEKPTDGSDSHSLDPAVGIDPGLSLGSASSPAAAPGT